VADQTGQTPNPFEPHPAGDPYATWYGQPHYGPGPHFGPPSQQGPDQQQTPAGYPAQPVWWMPNGATATGPMPPMAPRPAQRRRRRLIAIAAATAGVVMAGGITAVAVSHSSSNPQAVSTFTPNSLPSGNSSSGNGSGNGFPSWYGNGNTGNGSTTTTGQATTAQQVGVVDINTVINYGAEEAAGTGIVLTSNGEILTNNHVINGSTNISVTVVSTGTTYKATVVGDDPTDDVAVLQLSGASGLATAKLGDSSQVAVGNTVTAVGNAGGTGGVPSSATGAVTALNQSITASDEGGGNPENLTGMLEINADIQAGDSGGPLYASNGTIIGIDTAASSQSASGNTTGFAIPIAKATAIADQIESGNATSAIHIGAPGFLGVELASTGASGSFSSSGATISGTVSGSAAEQAGLQAGDTVTSINGQTVSSASGLSTAMEAFKPGQQVTIGWVDSSGQTHTATVTLGSGPAD
jgi:S1-C subfamily serine protease